MTAFSLTTALEKVGLDPLTYANTEAGTTVGAVDASNGLTTVSIYQTNRYTGDGSAAMAYSVSRDGGLTWTEGLLPGLTKATSAGNPYDRITYASIAFDQKHAAFLTSTLPIVDTPSNGDDDTILSPLVSSSADGKIWSAPVAIESGAIRPEKNYIACDNFRTSPFYGNCYVAWDDNDTGDTFHMNVTSDGGKTWSPTIASPDAHSAFGAIPVVQPNGNLVVTAEDSSGYDYTAQNQIAFVSTDGGKSVGPAIEVSPFTAHAVAGNMRTQSLPTSGVDSHGTAYMVWQDCRFRTNCSANDLVLSTSSNGRNWSAPSRIDLDPVTSTADHFLPTLSVSSGLFGAPLLGLAYYGFPNAACTTATCALTPYETLSADGGNTWSVPVAIAPAMNVTWLAATGAGYMVGDYFESNFRFNIGLLGDSVPLTVAAAPVGGVYNETTAVSLVTSLTGLRTFATHPASTSNGVHVFIKRPVRLAPRVSIRRAHHPM